MFADWADSKGQTGSWREAAGVHHSPGCDWRRHPLPPAKRLPCGGRGPGGNSDDAAVVYARPGRHLCGPPAQPGVGRNSHSVNPMLTATLRWRVRESLIKRLIAICCGPVRRLWAAKQIALSHRQMYVRLMCLSNGVQWCLKSAESPPWLWATPELHGSSDGISSVQDSICW